MLNLVDIPRAKTKLTENLRVVFYQQFDRYPSFAYIYAPIPTI